MNNDLTEKFIKYSKDALDITTNLIVGPNATPDKFSRILEGIARRNYFRIHSILLLAEDEFTGDSILDISRGMLEDMISVEFMKLKDKEKMADKFYKYTYIEQKNDMDFLVKNGKEVTKEMYDSIIKDYDEVKKQFMFKTNIVARSWAMSNLEQMIEELLNNKVLTELDKDMLLQGYLLGNKKNHLSPIDTLSYISSDFRELSKTTSKETGLLFSMVSYIKIADEFACSLKNTEISHSLVELLQKLNAED